MEESAKFFICTENYYLYKGVACSLPERLNYSVVWVRNINEQNLPAIKSLTEYDVMLILTETKKIDFYFLTHLCKCACKVIIANSEQNWLLNILFNFTVISRHFYLSDLLLAVHSKSNKNFNAKYPKFTKQEKKVLFYTYKGYSVSVMSKYLAIKDKTIYQHQRNALNKIGMDRPRSVVSLPKNFLEFLFHKHN